jgi:hypothetical protein
VKANAAVMATSAARIEPKHFFIFMESPPLAAALTICRLS